MPAWFTPSRQPRLSPSLPLPPLKRGAGCGSWRGPLPWQCRGSEMAVGSNEAQFTGTRFEFLEPGSKNTPAQNREPRSRSGARAKHFVSQALGLSPHMQPRPFIRSTAHAPDQPVLRSQPPQWFVDLAAPGRY